MVAIHEASCSRRRAFTLLELLIVVAIVVVLVAMLLPVLNRAREAAISVACVGNLHQLGLGMEGYAADNGTRLATGGSNTSGNVVSWYNFYTSDPDKSFHPIKSYVPPTNNGMNVTRCPRYKNPADNKVYGFFSVHHPAYGRWSVPCDPSPTTWLTSIDYFVLAKIQNRSDFMLATDTINMSTSANPPFGGFVSWTTLSYSGAANQPQKGYVYLAHSNRANGIFADFHVESCDAGRLYRLWNDGGSLSPNIHGLRTWVDVNLKVVGP